MKRLLSVLAGSLGVGLVAYFIIGVFGHWYENNVARSEDDLTVAYLWFLLVLAISFLAGGFLGNWIHRRSTDKRRSG